MRNLATEPQRARARPPPREIVATTSLERGHCPDPGVFHPPFAWEDCLDAPPPRRLARGEGAFVVYHGMIVDEDARVTFTTVVAVDPGEDPDDVADDVVRADARIHVQRRAAFEVMDATRRFADRHAARSRERLGARLARRRRRLNRWNVAWLTRAGVRLNRWEARVGAWRIRTVRRAMHALAEAPDALVSRTLHAYAHLSGRLDRRSLWNGIKDPSTLSNDQKSVVLFLSVVAILAIAIFLLDAIALVVPRYSATYRGLLTDATLTLLATVALPFPIETALVASALAVGPVLAFTGFFTGKMLGSWLLYFLGDALHEAVENGTATRPRLANAVRWMNANADRYGFWLLVPINALPLVPDVLLAVFALSGMRFRPYVAGIAVGTAIKFGGTVAIVHFLGVDALHRFVPGF